MQNCAILNSFFVKGVIEQWRMPWQSNWGPAPKPPRFFEAWPVFNLMFFFSDFLVLE